MGVDSGTAALIMIGLCGVSILGWGIRAGFIWLFKKMGFEEKE